MSGDIKKDSSSDRSLEALTAIRQLMFHNEITPGQKLAYRDLAQRLNMSPTPVSNALKYLEFQGLVRKEHHRGYFTEPISVKEVEEIYDFRELIEVKLLPQAIDRLDPAGEKLLSAAFEASLGGQSAPYVSQRASKDVRFHMTLAELSQNNTQTRALRHLIDLLYLKYGGNVLFSQYMQPEGYSAHIASSESCHQRIYDAVLAKDKKKARAALSQHIRGVKKDVLLGLKHMLEDKNGTIF